MFAGLIQKIKQLRTNDKGVSAVEFALILPVLLTLYLGTIDLSTYIIIDRKVSVVAGSVADLVARAEDKISATTVNDYFKAAEFTIKPYDSKNLVQRVTVVRIDKSGRAWVVWSRANNGGTALAKDSRIKDIPPQVAKANKKRFLVMGEAWNEVSPMIGYVFNSQLSFKERYFFRTRYDSVIDLV